MTELHLLGAQVSLVLVAVGAIGAVATLVLRRPPGTILLGGLVWVVIGLVATGLAGIAVAIDQGPPDDLLHVVYGLLAVSVLPGAALIAGGRSDAGRATILVVAMIVLVILVLRLFGTGA